MENMSEGIIRMAEEEEEDEDDDEDEEEDIQKKTKLARKLSRV
jgi:uncharacterized membrane protein